MDTLDKRSEIESEITKLTDEENEAKTTGEFDDIPPPPNGIYKNIKELTASIKEFAQLHGYAIVTKRTVTGKSVTYKSDRGGNPEQNQCKGDTRPPPRVTRLINCPSSALAYFHTKVGHWKFKVKNPNHNHNHTLEPAAHTANRRLTKELYEEMKKLGNAGLKPSAILEELKKTHPDKSILATLSIIYTARKKAQQELLQGISPILHLSRTLAGSDFTAATKFDDNGKLKV
ncbi:hypothetical protein PCASD_19196 [Puccinia coronata f. sp. avenae]|uniref:FAR1 domain-containing protein n=1 Tax=Puccinia coronata f. sp. avenae TaxID=200324 RepID=A0A2N5UKG5_9BASI|nr:hypothetical protein PCASD_19196 [Puccinia coronata f. sp. avenae]